MLTFHQSVPFCPKIVLAAKIADKQVDANTIDDKTDIGAYGHGAPIIDGGSYGILIVIKYSYYGYCAQVDFGFDGKCFYRTGLLNNGVWEWGAWYPITTTAV